MNETVFLWFNGWNGHSETLDVIFLVMGSVAFKALPFMLVFWALWFWPDTPRDRTRVREALTAALACTVPIIGLTRLVANYAPFSARPIHTPGLDVNLYDGQSVAILDGWSSLPSDHASLFFGFAVAILTIHRAAGLVLIVWAVCVTSLPRIVLGLHWPSDILAGWCIGAALALVLVGPVTRLVRKTGIVRYFEAREMIGYPLLFCASFEFVNMFQTSRQLVDALMQ